MLDPFVFRPRRKAGDPQDRKLAQRRSDGGLGQQRRRPAQPGNERGLGVGHHPEDVQRRRPLERVANLCGSLSRVDIGKPGHGVNPIWRAAAIPTLDPAGATFGLGIGYMSA